MNWNHPHIMAQRATVARVAVSLFTGALLFAFFRVQVLESDRYRMQSEQNRMRAVTVPAPRGPILDRNGVVLAENVPGYSVALIAPSVDSLSAMLARVGPIVGIDSSAWDGIVRRYRRAPFDPVVIHRDAPFEVISALEERRVTIPGLVIQSEPKRRYPFGPIAAHAIGYVSEITEREMARRAVRGARPGALVGRDGLEREYDDVLRGQDGVRFVEVDALGRTVRDRGVAARLEPEQGVPLRTTLDIELQQFVADQFPAGRGGAVVAMDPRNGEILAMYSSPAYDPNEFIGGIDPEIWRQLATSEEHPLINRTIQASYAPASPWKLLVAAIALKRGVVSWGERMPIPCRGGMPYGNRFFRCWKLDGHGDLTLEAAIQHSCNVYFYQLGVRLTLEALLQDAAAVGASRPAGIDLPNERTPTFPASVEYYNRRYGPRGWTRAVTLNLAIGQGENVQTPLSVAHLFAMLAHPEGKGVVPYLVQPRNVPPHGLELSPRDLAGLRSALVSVVEEGTAVRSRVADLRIAGKTGTGQNPHGPNHAWFVAFAPADDPRILVSTIVEFAEHGSAVAPMVTSIIARHLLGPGGVPVRGQYRLVVPADSAPAPITIMGDPPDVLPRP